MATREERSGSSVTTAAEIVGRAAGQAAGAVDTFRSRHPHPISEVGEALTAGQEALTDLPHRRATARPPLSRKQWMRPNVLKPSSARLVVGP
jgi:hypothetical protein